MVPRDGGGPPSASRGRVDPNRPRPRPRPGQQPRQRPGQQPRQRPEQRGRSAAGSPGATSSGPAARDGAEQPRRPSRPAVRPARHRRTTGPSRGAVVPPGPRCGHERSVVDRDHRRCRRSPRGVPVDALLDRRRSARRRRRRGARRRANVAACSPQRAAQPRRSRPGGGRDSPASSCSCSPAWAARGSFVPVTRRWSPESMALATIPAAIAAASIVLAVRLDLWAGVFLIVAVSLYDAGSFLLGADAAGRWEGPAGRDDRCAGGDLHLRDGAGRSACRPVAGGPSG